MFAIVVHIIPHATDLGISAGTAANVLAIFGGSGIVGRVLGGITADRIGGKRIFIIGSILMSASLFWLPAAREIWSLYLFAGVFGFANSCGVAMSPLLARVFGLRAHGAIFGVTAFGFTIGAAISPLLTGYIFDVTGSYQRAFLVCATLGVVGLILASTLTPIKGGRSKL